MLLCASNGTLEGTFEPLNKGVIDLKSDDGRTDVKSKVYAGYVKSCPTQNSETWLIEKEHEVKLDGTGKKGKDMQGSENCRDGTNQFLKKGGLR